MGEKLRGNTMDAVDAAGGNQNANAGYGVPKTAAHGTVNQAGEAEVQQGMQNLTGWRGQQTQQPMGGVGGKLAGELLNLSNLTLTCFLNQGQQMRRYSLRISKWQFRLKTRHRLLRAALPAPTPTPRDTARFGNPEARAINVTIK